MGQRNCFGTVTCCFPLIFPCYCFPPLQSTAVCNFNQVFPQFFRSFFRQFFRPFFWQIFCQCTRAWPSETPRSLVAKNLASYERLPESSIELFAFRSLCAFSTCFVRLRFPVCFHNVLSFVFSASVFRFCVTLVLFFLAHKFFFPRVHLPSRFHFPRAGAPEPTRPDRTPT